jgi:diguanylate cyclase (GGDEF)-like protein
VGDRVLVVDDDADVRSVVEITLELAGYDVICAEDGAAALRAVQAHVPDLIVLDVMMPNLDGFEVVRTLREDARYSHIPIVMLTAKAQLDDKVTGLTGGADDYVTKPFDADELVARVTSALRRSRQTGSLSPLTGLPGNVRIQQELARRGEEGARFAVLYADMNHFKSMNDRYSWMRGDDMINLLAEVLRRTSSILGDERTFLGHIGGDDFVVITAPERAEAIARQTVLEFDERALELYDEQDRERGYIEVLNRQGEMERYPPVTVSIGVVTAEDRDLDDHRQLVEIATEMKNYAKRHAKTADPPRSNYAIDRRAD